MTHPQNQPRGNALDKFMIALDGEAGKSARDEARVVRENMCSFGYGDAPNGRLAVELRDIRHLARLAEKAEKPQRIRTLQHARSRIHAVRAMRIGLTPAL